MGYMFFDVIGSPNKKGGRGIVITKIFTGNAADHLADCSVKWIKNGGA